jgi:hypothetical protein
MESKHFHLGLKSILKLIYTYFCFQNLFIIQPLEIIVISGADTNNRHCDHKTLQFNVHTLGYNFLTRPYSYKRPISALHTKYKQCHDWPYFDYKYIR